MSQALIKIFGIIGSNTDLTINIQVQLNNDNIGDEISFLWEILDQPAGTSDLLSDATIENPTFTPKKEGTYLIRLTVDKNLPSEDTDTVDAAVLLLKTRQRVPAAGEQTEASASRGWAVDTNAQLRFINDGIADPGTIVVANADVGSLARGKVVRTTSQATIKPGLPGEEKLPGVTLAPATIGGNVDELLMVIEGDVLGGASIAAGALGVARFIGRFGDFALGLGEVGDPVFVNDSADLSVTPGTNRRQVGSIMDKTGANRDIWFAGTQGGDSAPIDRAYVVFGSPGILPNANRIDGLNATGAINNIPYTFKAADVSTVPLVAKRFSAVGADIFQAQNEGGGALSRVRADGSVDVTAPRDGALVATATSAGDGIKGIGNTGGAGMRGTGGVTGPGVVGAGGSSGGVGVSGTSQGAAEAVKGERNTSVTAVTESAVLAKLKTTGNMADGFGPRYDFSIEDATSGDKSIARIAAKRDGADDSGELVFSLNRFGAFADRVRIRALGLLNALAGIQGDGDSGVNSGLGVLGRGTVPSGTFGSVQVEAGAGLQGVGGNLSGGVSGYGVIAAAPLTAAQRTALRIVPQIDEPTAGKAGDVLAQNPTSTIHSKLAHFNGAEFERLVPQVFASISATDELDATNGTSQDFVNTYTIPGGTLRIGSTIRIRAAMEHTAAVGATTTVNFALLVGTLNVLTTSIRSLDIGPPNFAQIEAELSLRAIGAGSAVGMQGRAIHSDESPDSIVDITQIVAAAGIGDTDSPQTVRVRAGFNNTVAGNKVRLVNLIVDVT